MKDKAYSRKILGCLFSLLFAAIIFVGFAPSEAKASDELMWWAERTTAEYGRSKLTEAQQVLWDELYGTLHDFTVAEGFEKDTWDDKSFIVTVKFADSSNKNLLATLTEDDIIKAYTVFRADNPIFFFLGQGYSYSFGEEGSLSIKPAECYLTPESRLRAETYLYEIGSKWYDWISHEVDTGADATYSVVRAVHDLIINRIDYARASNGQPSAEGWAHSLAGVFTGDGVVCEGYAKAFKYMLDLLNIENIYITGKGGGDDHAWNAVKIDDEWLLVDVTWDDLKVGPDSKESPAGCYDWFCVPAEEFNEGHEGKKHIPDSASALYALPEFSESDEYVYYKKYNSLSNAPINNSNVKAFVEAGKVSAPGAYIYYAVPDDDSLRALITELKTDKRSFFRDSIFGLNLFIYVDEEKYEPPFTVDYQYPGDENQQQQPTVTVLEGTTEHIWAKGSKEYSKVTIKPSIKASTYKDAKGKTKQGKLGYVVLSSDTGIEFDTTNHKVTTKSDKSVATVSGKGVVSAKSPGTAYVYAYDTGSFKVEKFTINVAMAPTKLALTSVPGIADKDYLIKKTSLDPGCGELIYLVEEAGNFSVSGGTSYKVVVEGEAKNVLTATEVTRDEKGNQSFTITAKEKPVSATKLAKAKVTVINNESGKKVKLNVSIGNPVTDIIVDGSGSLAKKGDSVDLKVSFVTPYGTGLATTDGVKVAVSLSDPDVEDKKVTLEKGSDIKYKYDKKTGNLTVTAAKDIKEGGGVYLILKDKGSGEWKVFCICTVDSSGNLRI